MKLPPPKPVQQKSAKARATLNYALCWIIIGPLARCSDRFWQNIPFSDKVGIALSVTGAISSHAASRFAAGTKTLPDEGGYIMVTAR